MLQHHSAFATIQYPFIDETNGLPNCLDEIKRSVQFLRYHAKDFNLNKAKIGAYGGSAGGGASIWMAFKDDMADASNEDPVLRESTRLQAVGHLTSQASYDPLVMDQIFDAVGVDFFSLPHATEDTLEEFGISSLSELTTNPAIVTIRHDLDMLGWMSSDDPEFYTANDNEDVPPTTKSTAVHHPLQAKTLVDRAAEVGIVANAKIPSMPAIPQTTESVMEYMNRMLNE